MNGTIKGVTYFNCPDNQGVIIPIKKFTFTTVWQKVNTFWALKELIKLVFFRFLPHNFQGD